MIASMLGIGSINSVNVCYYAWNERITPDSCSTASDCNSPVAECIFSLTANQHVCCAPKSNAVFPVCPVGMSIATLGKHNSILCDGLNDKDSCPEGFSCKDSVTNFDKYEGQTNFVCCQ
uniref:CC domain-containing protein n=1 Tax=Rhabditophanes sp. KR3021 TaxID=114890 RepID=A0AC35TRE7_9BILA